MSFIRSFPGFISAFGEVTRSPLSSAFETAAAASSEPRPSGLSGFPCERDKDITRLTDFLFENREGTLGSERSYKVTLLQLSYWFN